jgi:pimeloyl-ACP methyl ester carboxylesterase
MDRINAPVTEMNVRAIDGINLRVYQCGNGYHRWLLPPGAGTPMLSWKYLMEYFQDSMTIVTWDPRGCYGSDVPSDPERLAIENHVDDAFSILEHLGWSDGTFVCGGWSMAVQISLELYHRIPERISALVLINGAFEQVLKTAFGLPKSHKLMRGALHVMSAASGIFDPMSKYLLSQDWSVDLLKNMKIVSHNEDFFAEVAQQFTGLEFGPYFKLMLKMDEHSARSILPEVRVPTLITAGTADQMTPLSTARFMQSQIAGSELFEIPNGTHYTTIEYPEIVNLKLEQFFRRRVFGKSWENPR